MRIKMGTMELLAILAVAGITCDGATAADSQANSERVSSMQAVEAPQLIASSGKEGACGKCGANSCGASYYAHLKQKKQHSAQMRRLRKRSKVAKKTVAGNNLNTGNSNTNNPPSGNASDTGSGQ